tara:strand:+ start:228 stop:491 length:264 start_codon:yes stop_codon:yes gene_type:complete
MSKHRIKKSDSLNKGIQSIPEPQYLDNDFMNNSTLYKEFLAERDEILKHKWIESEKAGTDIGFERALLDWIRKYRTKWKAHRKTHRQ